MPRSRRSAMPLCVSASHCRSGLAGLISRSYWPYEPSTSCCGAKTSPGPRSDSSSTAWRASPAATPRRQWGVRCAHRSLSTRTPPLVGPHSQ
eukprot:208086-Prymnesium_polylepis.1